MHMGQTLYLIDSVQLRGLTIFFFIIKATIYLSSFCINVMGGPMVRSISITKKSTKATHLPICNM